MRAYEGTGFGQKYRMQQARCAASSSGADTTNAMVDKNIRALNDEPCSCAGYGPHCREDQERVYYYKNMLLIRGSASRATRCYCAQGRGQRMPGLP